MSITVISALPGASQPGIAALGGGQPGEDAAAGGFAALLSGELLSQIGLIAGIGATDPNAAVTGKTSDKPTPEDDAAAALLASLFGASAGLPPENPAATTVTTSIADAPVSADLPAAPVIASDRRAPPELPAAKTLPQGTGGTVEKLADNGKDAAAMRAPAANIAGATPAGETPTAVSGQIAAASAHAATTVAHAAQTVGAPQQSVAAPLHSPVWPREFGDKIVWLARNEQQTAQLNINPPQLGPVQITLKLSGEQASIAFASPHAEVRQAIESAMPQLKDMLSSAGINLGQTNVGANLHQPRGDTAFAAADGTRLADENAILPANEKGAGTGGTAVLQRGRGLVDLFA
ncbi:MAG: flagellar hook-length control protein FliK [Betaproteobacteria bacterium]|nr:flagellar hook-length control protein FliK [Betaproteobacteria bacterium]MCL2885331.1 flagellar hook-length control protein FliK [Betaproteobacteria bacterium]